MPATTCSNRYRDRSDSRSPNRSESSTAIGRAPSANTSRRIPPTPVAAPWNGSTALGWLCDSTLNATACPLPTSTAPAFSPGPISTRSPSVGSRRSSLRECLYAQCSDHSSENIASSTSFGSRSRSSVMRPYSKSVSPSSRCLDSLETLIARPVFRAPRRSAAPCAPKAPKDRAWDPRPHSPPQAGLDSPEPVGPDTEGPISALEPLPELAHARALAAVLRRSLRLRLQVAADRVHRVGPQLLGRRAAPARGRRGRLGLAIDEGVGAGGEIVAKAGVLDEPAFLDPLGHLFVVEGQPVVDLLEAPPLESLADRAPLLVSLELAVVAGDLGPPAVLLERSKREVENADRERRRDHELQWVVLAMLGFGAKDRLSHQPPVRLTGPDLDGVRPAQADAVAGAVGRLRRPAKARLAHRHPVGEGALSRPHDEFCPGRQHHPELLRDRLEGLLQVPRRRPPELVGVVVDDPVRSHLAGDAGDPLLTAALHVVNSADGALEAQDPRALVSLEDLDRAVHRSRVDDDEEVHTLREVEPQVVLDDVRLVAGLVDHSQTHGRRG